jgi:hypothetical protein
MLLLCASKSKPHRKHLSMKENLVAIIEEWNYFGDECFQHPSFKWFNRIAGAEIFKIFNDVSYQIF